MENISSFLEKFKKFLSSSVSVKQSVVEVLKDVLGVDVDTKSINIKNSFVFIKCSPALKNAIFLKKKLIIDGINQKTKASISDIR